MKKYILLLFLLIPVKGNTAEIKEIQDTTDLFIACVRDEPICDTFIKQSLESLQNKRIRKLIPQYYERCKDRFTVANIKKSIIKQYTHAMDELPEDPVYMALPNSDICAHTDEEIKILIESTNAK